LEYQTNQTHQSCLEDFGMFHDKSSPKSLWIQIGHGKIHAEAFAMLVNITRDHTLLTLLFGSAVKPTGEHGRIIFRCSEEPVLPHISKKLEDSM
jgi:hypothetical protein